MLKPADRTKMILASVRARHKAEKLTSRLKLADDPTRLPLHKPKQPLTAEQLAALPF